MRILDKLYQIERIDALIRRKSTGSPKQLASKLDISERAVYDCIDLMKSMDAPVYYCRYSQSYCYKTPVVFSYGFNQYKGGAQRVFGGRVLSFWKNVILHV